jgi:uncharacterized protein YecT (DUF1311 family)
MPKLPLPNQNLRSQTRSREGDSSLWLLPLWLLFVSGGQPPIAVAQSPNCSNLRTSLDMNTCAGLSWERADLALNEAFQALTPNLSDSRKLALAEAQLRWIEFRDAECQFSSSWAEGGSLQPALEAGCQAELTEQRTIELKSYAQDNYPPAQTDNYGSVREQLDSVYQQLQQRLSEPRLMLLSTSDLAWAAFRETACEFERGGGGNAALTNCLIRLTETRIEQLQNHLESP